MGCTELTAPLLRWEVDRRGFPTRLAEAWLRLSDADGSSLVESQHLTGSQLEDRFRITEFFPIQLDAALFDEATHIRARFCDQKSVRIGRCDKGNDVRVGRTKCRQIGLGQFLFTEARVPISEGFLSGFL